ncbi:hypothetical protein Bca4012_019045 [Brassica carinata]
MPTCAEHNRCKIVSGTTCPPGYPYTAVRNSGDIVNEYCKLGCATSVCGALTTLQDSDASEIVNGAVAQCTNACANFCTKGSANASECGHHGHILALYVKTSGDLIFVGDLMKSISNWMSAVEILDDDTYLGAENNFNLLTVKKNSEGATDEERGRLEVVGEYHLGEFVSRFCHGSLVMRLSDSEIGKIPIVIFCTVNGVIGVIASLPQEQ